MRPTLDTRALLRRSRLTRDTALRLAWLEGASYHLVLSATRVMCYRHVFQGPVQCAMAACDDTGWTLSAWADRVVPRLPPTAQPLDRPGPDAAPAPKGTVPWLT